MDQRDLAHDFLRLADHFAVQKGHQEGMAEVASAAMEKAYRDAGTRLLALLPEVENNHDSVQEETAS